MVLGCWSVTASPFSGKGPTGAGVDPGQTTLPSIVKFDSLPGPLGAELRAKSRGHLIQGVTGYTMPMYRSGYYQFQQHDSLEIVWYDASDDTRLTLGADSLVMRGRAEAGTDYLGEEHGTVVRPPAGRSPEPGRRRNSRRRVRVHRAFRPTAGRPDRVEACHRHGGTMTEYEFPLRAVHSLVERIDQTPLGSQVRRWVLRDDNDQHYHGVVPLTTDALFLELRWKPDTCGREQIVGLYRLHLAALLAAGYIRRAGGDVDSTQVRLRFHRGARGVVSIQINQSEPGLPIGMVDRTFA